MDEEHVLGAREVASVVIIEVEHDVVGAYVLLYHLNYERVVGFGVL